MNVFDAILGRRSCRKFFPRPVEPDKINKILECAIHAPSPKNSQPWEFIVTSNPLYNQKVRAATEAAKDKVAARSGWKWIPHFKVDFITEAPVLIVVVGDPNVYGGEHFLDVPSPGYQQGCSAAIQNMSLAAYALGLQSLWLSLFEKADVRAIFDIPAEKDPIAVLCIGYGEPPGVAPRREELEKKVRFLD